MNRKFIILSVVLYFAFLVISLFLAAASERRAHHLPAARGLANVSPPAAVRGNLRRAAVWSPQTGPSFAPGAILPSYPTWFRGSGRTVELQRHCNGSKSPNFPSPTPNFRICKNRPAGSANPQTRGAPAPAYDA